MPSSAVYAKLGHLSSEDDMPGPQPRPLAERFWEKVRKTEGCWIWTARKTKKGYGHFRVNNTKRMFAHRLAYTLTHGEVSENLQVCHHCDNPPCCNPDHLFLGTNADNVADRERKGRSARTGAIQYRLTADQVADIRARHQQGVMQSTLADEYGVCRAAIGKIVRGETWKHLL
jgi:hypothetical protein